VNLFLFSCSDKKEEKNSSSDFENKLVEQKFDSSYVNGRLLYASNCIQCHELDSVLVGPALAKISQRRSLDWIKKWIKSPDGMIQSGDSTALVLYSQYQQYMPRQDYLLDKDIEDIVHFLDEQAKTNATDSIALAELFILKECEGIEEARKTEKRVVLALNCDKCEKEIYDIANKIDFINLSPIKNHKFNNPNYPKTKEEIEIDNKTKAFAKKMKELNPSIRIELSN
jgi:cytochrome c2